MVGKYKVITLCGSTRFKNAFMEAQKRLTLEGNIDINVGLFGHSGDDKVWTENTKEMLDDKISYSKKKRQECRFNDTYINPIHFRQRDLVVQ